MVHAEVEDVFEGLRVGVAGAGTVVDEVDDASVWGTEECVARPILRGTLTRRLVGGLWGRRGRVSGSWWCWWCWWSGWRWRRRLGLELELGLEAGVDWHRHGISGKVTGVESWHGHRKDSW